MDVKQQRGHNTVRRDNPVQTAPSDEEEGGGCYNKRVPETVRGEEIHKCMFVLQFPPVCFLDWSFNTHTHTDGGSHQPCRLVHRCHCRPLPPTRKSQQGPVYKKPQKTHFKKINYIN